MWLISKDEVRTAMKRMKSGKAVGPDDIPVEAWKCLGESSGLSFETRELRGRRSGD